jgi:hypothetical protein
LAGEAKAKAAECGRTPDVADGDAEVPEAAAQLAESEDMGGVADEEDWWYDYDDD